MIKRKANSGTIGFAELSGKKKVHHRFAQMTQIKEEDVAGNVNIILLICSFPNFLIRTLLDRIAQITQIKKEKVPGNVSPLVLFEFPNRHLVR
jgi:hypothetical protein